MAMRKAICVGDSPVTGGAVLPYPFQWENNLSGHQVAMINGKVYCEACKSTGIIIKTGGSYRVKYDTGFEYGETALEGDACLCKCSPPPPIMATVAEWCLDVEDTRYGEGAPLQAYDEQFRLQNEEGKFFESFGYVLTLEDGTKFSGTTDEHGRTERINTDKPMAVKKVEIFSRVEDCCTVYAADTKNMGAYEYKPEPNSMMTNAKNLGTSILVSVLKRIPRSLTAGEIAIAKTMFKDAVNYSTVKVHRGTYIVGQRDDTAMTPNGEMYFPDGVYEPDFSKGDQSFFIHEMTH